jgi:photosystem II stability/assembly factor-like uncharacterized protein
MKKIIYILIFLAFASMANAQWVPYTNFPTTNTIGGISIPATNSNYVFVATYNSVNPNQTLLIKSSNRGESWIQMNTFPPFFAFPTSIVFNSIDQGIAIGANSIIATTNGGSSWGTLYVTSDTVLFKSFAVSPNTNVFWFIGKKISGMNLGAPVVLMNSNYPTGTFLRLNLPASFSNYQLTSICVKGNSTCIISTLEHPPVFLKTTNAGNNWSVISIGGNDREIWDMVRYDLNDDIIAVGGNNGCLSIYKSSNFGDNWSSILDIQNTTGPFRAVNTPFEFIRPSMYAVGTGGCIYKTTDSGLNWFPQISNLTCNIKYITKAYPNGEFAVAGGDFTNFNNNYLNGEISITTNGGGPIGIVPISTEIPSLHSLSQNYPNPFNPSTYIEFDVSKSSFVSLKVFDVLGREVAALVNENLKPGTYEVDWNASNYPSGVYFYTLVVGENTNKGNNISFTETKRMVLLK